MELADRTIHKTLYHPQILPDSNTPELTNSNAQNFFSASRLPQDFSRF